MVVWLRCIEISDDRMKKMAILQSIGPFAVGKRFSGLQA
jgi:hypothetical protein